MPSPDGCYVQVWESANFAGEFGYINGPRDYPMLSKMPNEARWHNRIQSVRVGSTATATAFTREAFQGPSLRFTADSNNPQLPEAFSSRIVSLRITCDRPTIPAQG